MDKADRWRVGTKNPHNLYKDDLPAGFIVDAVDAIELCHAMNVVEAARAPKRCSGCGVSPLLTIEGACRRCGYGHK